MKPYTLTISAAEQTMVHQALSRGLFCAKEQVRAGMIGADKYVSQIEAALEIMDRPCEGGFETADERMLAVVHSWAKDCDQYGSN